jgi:vacuolar protein sorting-associated protein 54
VDKLTRSAKWVEQEEWKAIEVSPRSQRVVELIISSAVSDPPEIVFVKATVERGKNIKPSDTASPATSPDPDAGDITMANGPSNPGDDHAAPHPDGTTAVEVIKAKCLVIEDRSFYIVAATLQVLGLVIDYLKVMANLNGLTMECMSRLVEFLKV